MLQAAHQLVFFQNLIGEADCGWPSLRGSGEGKTQDRRIALGLLIGIASTTLDCVSKSKQPNFFKSGATFWAGSDGLCAIMSLPATGSLSVSVSPRVACYSLSGS